MLQLEALESFMPCDSLISLSFTGVMHAVRLLDVKLYTISNSHGTVYCILHRLRVFGLLLDPAATADRRIRRRIFTRLKFAEKYAARRICYHILLAQYPL